MSQGVARTAERMALNSIKMKGFDAAWRGAQNLYPMADTSQFASVYIDVVVQYGLDQLRKGLDSTLR